MRVLPNTKGYFIDFHSGRFLLEPTIIDEFYNDEEFEDSAGAIGFNSRDGWKLMADARKVNDVFLKPDGNDVSSAWRCPCGNEIDESQFNPSQWMWEKAVFPDNWMWCGRFYPCNWIGEEVERSPWVWPEPLYACQGCGRIIHADWMAITSLLQEEKASRA